MSLVKIGVTSMINKEETWKKVKQLWDLVKSHKKISIAVAVVIVIIIITAN